MIPILKAAVAAAGRFVLPWLFAAWACWQLSALPVTWESWVPVAAAALLGYFLQNDAKPVLERFCRLDNPGPTPDKAERPAGRLRGVGRLLEVYLITALAWYVGFFVMSWLLRAHTASSGAAQSDATEQLMFGAALPASGLAFLAYVAGRWFFFQRTGSILRGRRVKNHKDARKELSCHREPAEPEIIWGGVRLPWSSGPRHFLAAGMTGSGKTNLLLQFMASTLTWIGRKPDQRALVYDPKTELFSFLYGLGIGSKVRILHPLDRRGCAWDLAADVTSPTTAQQMAAILIPDDKESKQPFFTMASQQLLAGVFTFLMRATPGKWDLRDVIFIMEQKELLRQCLKRYPETAPLVEQYFEPDDTFANVRSTVANWLCRYRPIAACWHHATEKVSLEDWITGEYVLLLGQDDSIRVQMDAINRALLVRACQLILRGHDNPTRRSWLIVDEVRELGHLDGLSRFLTTARSKGACFCGGYQTPSGMKDAVGEHIADEINDNIWHWALCRMGGDVSADWASKLVGEVEFEEQTESVGPGGRSTSTSIAKRRALLPEYFMELPPPTPKTGVAGVFITPFTGAYTHSVPGLEIAAARRLARADVSNFLPRPGDHQELPPWTEEDYRRLGLQAESGGDNQQQTAPGFDSAKLRFVGRRGTNA